MMTAEQKGHAHDNVHSTRLPHTSQEEAIEKQVNAPSQSKRKVRKQVCQKAGCIPYRGVFRCEFSARSNNDDQGERKRLAQRGTTNLSSKPWKQYCTGERECEWMIRYLFDSNMKHYTLTLVNSTHQGHSFRHHCRDEQTLSSLQSARRAMADVAAAVASGAEILMQECEQALGGEVECGRMEVGATV